LDQQVFTLLGTLLGAFVGLSAPIVSSRLAARVSNRDSQRTIADAILNLFSDGQDPTIFLKQQENPDRRKLYLLALRLQNEKARRACLEFIAHVNSEAPKRDDTQRAWENLVTQVAEIYTSMH
jgi:hypothetical protein